MHQVSEMTKINPLIVWEKWVDPLGGDEENSFIEKDDEDTESPTMIKTKPVKMLLTPMGMIPYNENTATSSIFNFWVGHSNFDISPEICDLIEQAYGVETLDIFTRYRFRIGVGKVFDDGDVMRNINNIIYQRFNYDKPSN
jgi:hypothetical protein